MVVAVVCLQAQRVAGLPASVGGIELTCRLVQHPPHVHPLDDDDDDGDGVDDYHEARAAQRASASVSGGTGDFGSQVLLLHCGAITPSLKAVLTVSLRHPGRRHHHHQQHLQVHLGAEQPGVLTYPLTGAAAGALLTLALHRKLISLPAPATATGCCLPLPACCRQQRRGNNTNNSHNQQQQQHGIQYDSGDESSAGFIVIEKELTRPPSESLATTTADGNIDQDNMKLDQEELDRVEDEFLAMLELSADTTTCVDFDLDLHLYLDKLVREAEAELGNASITRLPNAAAASHVNY